MQQLCFLFQDPWAVAVRAANKNPMFKWSMQETVESNVHPGAYLEPEERKSIAKRYRSEIRPGVPRPPGTFLDPKVFTYTFYDGDDSTEPNERKKMHYVTPMGRNTAQTALVRKQMKTSQLSVSLAMNACLYNLTPNMNCFRWTVCRCHTRHLPEESKCSHPRFLEWTVTMQDRRFHEISSRGKFLYIRVLKLTFGTLKRLPLHVLTLLLQLLQT